MGLEHFIRQQRRQKEILLMSHTVLGYPSLDDNRRAIAALVQAGVELIELQFPFSEPIADGPTLMAANHAALQSGVSTQGCLDFAAEMAQQYSQTRFITMSYVNPLFRYGMDEFIRIAAQNGIAGCIVPDLPPEQAKTHIAVARDQGLSTIFLVTPESTPQRIQQILRSTSGLAYCVARSGVTGEHTQFSERSHQYLNKVRSLTSLPVAVGFGVQSAADIQALVGHADIAIIGSQAVKQYVDHGAAYLSSFMEELRSG